MNRLLPLAALVALSLAGPAQAGLFDDTDARRQITEMRQDLESRLETSNRGQLELANQNEQLRAEIARLRGQLEVVLNEVESLKQRQRDFYVDLDTRLRQLETLPQTTPAATADPAEAAAEYEAALNLLKDGKARESLTAFDAYLSRFPDSTSAPGAHFWAGNAALQSKEVAAAVNHFNAVLGKWPNDIVAPDAMLGLANSQQAMGDAKTSQRTLQSLIERYPTSNAAQAAKQRLAKR
ncbi:tol-pal system protein YbgF [Azoarcus sp. L1K30]|uniref:tol-pal system protein YbgF n=1 Tax=Azoarcus sp. L1K30 TaxID=2820277 RepID=UPI001B813982|nr:tol-pal system protein YbgF [Azoarcus sp. L1K30]MBR0566738.1 tol-pal system protein YbgF [Azoarcus sp. L1K30]